MIFQFFFSTGDGYYRRSITYNDQKIPFVRTNFFCGESVCKSLIFIENINTNFFFVQKSGFIENLIFGGKELE